MTVIVTAEDHTAARDELLRLCSTTPSRRDLIEEVKARIEAIEAEAHRQIRRDVTDVYCWIIVRYPSWLGYYHIQVPPGPDLRTITSVSPVTPNPSATRDMLKRDASAAFRALGYAIAPPAPTYSDPQVSYPDRHALSTHRRLEGYGRVKKALAAELRRSLPPQTTPPFATSSGACAGSRPPVETPAEGAAERCAKP